MIDYYPFGMEITPPTGVNSGKNPYLYSGKELDRMHGLNQYDFTGRWTDNALAGFTTVDPLAEYHFSESPYSYCGNDPVNRIDPTGLDWYYNQDGEDPVWMDGDEDIPGYEFHSRNYCTADKNDNYQWKKYGPQDGGQSFGVTEAMLSLWQSESASYNNTTEGIDAGGNDGNNNNNNSGNNDVSEIIDLGFKSNDVVDKAGTLTSASILGAQKLGNTLAKTNYAILKVTALEVAGKVTGWISLVDNSRKFIADPKGNWWNGVQVLGQIGLTACGAETALMIYNLSTLTIDLAISGYNAYNNSQP